MRKHPSRIYERALRQNGIVDRIDGSGSLLLKH
jgi:hypothetical protein